MGLEELRAEAEKFFEWPSNTKNHVTLTSAIIFAQLMMQKRSPFGLWFDKETHPPKREAGQKILAYGGYVFEVECDEDGDWCSIGGDDFTHWMPYFEPPHNT